MIISPNGPWWFFNWISTEIFCDRFTQWTLIKNDHFNLFLTVLRVFYLTFMLWLTNLKFENWSKNSKFGSIGRSQIESLNEDNPIFLSKIRLLNLKNWVKMLDAIKMNYLFEIRLKYNEVTISNGFERIKSTIQTCCMEQWRRRIFLQVRRTMTYRMAASLIFPWS